jgi:hypothetical protein
MHKRFLTSTVEKKKDSLSVASICPEFFTSSILLKICDNLQEKANQII